MCTGSCRRCMFIAGQKTNVFRPLEMRNPRACSLKSRVSRASTSKYTCFYVTHAEVKRTGGKPRPPGKAGEKNIVWPPELRWARIWPSSNGPGKHGEGLTRLGPRFWTELDLIIRQKSSSKYVGPAAPICLSDLYYLTLIDRSQKF